MQLSTVNGVPTERAPPSPPVVVQLMNEQLIKVHDRDAEIDGRVE